MDSTPGDEAEQIEPVGNWFKVPNAIIDDYAKVIGPTALAVVVALHRYVNERGECWPSVPKLAKVLGIGERSVRREIQKLESLKIVTKRPRYNGTGGTQSSNLYFLACPPFTGGQNSHPHPIQNGSPTLAGLAGSPYPECHPHPAKLDRGTRLREKDLSKKTQGRRPSEKDSPACGGDGPPVSKSSKFKFSIEDREIAEHIFSKLLAINPDHKKPNLDSWANDIRLMRESDERSPEDIRAVFNWANSDDFWKTNVLSPASLRKNFDRLTIQKNNPRQSKQVFKAGPGQTYDPNAGKNDPHFGKM